MKTKKLLTKKLSHLNAKGDAHMVDIGHKPVQTRTAKAKTTLHCSKTALLTLKQQALPKGDAIAVARVAGIQAVKKTADLIPLCHPLSVNHVCIDFSIFAEKIVVECTVSTSGKTGVEMEALTGATVATLALYDMLKAVDKTMRIEDIHVTEKQKR